MQKLIMGEYALIIGASYGLALVLLGGLAIVSLRQLRAAKKKLAALEE